MYICDFCFRLHATERRDRESVALTLYISDDEVSCATLRFFVYKCPAVIRRDLLSPRENYDYRIILYRYRYTDIEIEAEERKLGFCSVTLRSIFPRLNYVKKKKKERIRPRV